MYRIFFMLLLLLHTLYAMDINTTLFELNRTKGVTLHSSLHYALEHNYKIQSSKQTLVKSHQKVKEAFSAYLPTLALSGDVGYENRTITPDNISDKFGQTSVFDYAKTDLFLTLTQNIWSGGGTQYALKEQQARLKAVYFNHQLTVEKVIIDVISTYFDIVYSEIALNINEKNMQDFKKVLKIMQIKEKNGAATKGDLNFIKANVKNAQSELLSTQTQLIDAKAKYQYLLGLDTLDTLPFELSAPVNLKDLNSSIASLKKKNSKLLRDKAYIDASIFSYKAQKSSYDPKLDLKVNAEARDEKSIREGSLGAIGQQAKANVMLNFTYNLYKGGRDEAKSKRLLATISEQKFARKNLEYKYIYETKVLHRTLKALDSSIGFVQSEVKSSRKVVDAYWLSFKEGTQDLQALQQALRTKNRAELDYVRFRKQLIVKYFKLLRNSGTLLQVLNIQTDNLR